MCAYGFAKRMRRNKMRLRARFSTITVFCDPFSTSLGTHKHNHFSFYKGNFFRFTAFRTAVGFALSDICFATISIRIKKPTPKCLRRWFAQAGGHGEKKKPTKTSKRDKRQKTLSAFKLLGRDGGFPETKCERKSIRI